MSRKKNRVRRDINGKGWVYIITNPALLGLVKVGFSMYDPKGRAKEIDGAGVPFEYKVRYSILIESPHLIEKRCHDALSPVKEGREWFKCSVGEAIRTIREVAGGHILYESVESELDQGAIEDTINSIPSSSFEKVAAARPSFKKAAPASSSFKKAESGRSTFIKPNPEEYLPDVVVPPIGSKNELSCYRCHVPIERSSDLRWRCPSCKLRWSTVNSYWKRYPEA